jgi:sRNA-binding regulator protein Hfq
MGRGTPPPKQKTDFWDRVAEIERTTGIPKRLAQQVAAGQITLNTALEKLAQQDRVEGLMRRHGMSRALATQVAIGHADLGAVLRKVRMKEHKDAHYNRSLLDDAAADGRVVRFALHGGRQVEGVVKSIDRYEFDMDVDGASERIHKLTVKFAMVPDDAKRVRRALRFDKNLKDRPKDPIVRPQDRYTCSDRRLFSYIDDRTQVKVTLLEGEQFRGEITAMCRYEFVLKLKGGVEIVIFRHSLADISEG